MSLPTLHAMQWKAEQEARIDALLRQQANERRAELRRGLYQTDPLWRLSKLKVEREYRLRRKVA